LNREEEQYCRNEKDNTEVHEAEHHQLPIHWLQEII
jgi:hypothetical protein